MTVKCQTKKFIPTYDYPAAVQAAEAQAEIFWLPTEPKVEKDLHCLKTELSPAQLHGVMTTLKLFTLIMLSSVKDHLRSVPEICFFFKKNRFSIDLRLRPKFLVSGSKFCHGAESGVKKFLARLKRALSDFESPKTRSEPYQNRPKVVFETCSFLHGIFSQT